MFKPALFGTIGALVAVAITHLIGDAVSGPLLAKPPGGDAVEEVALGAALFATVVGGVAGAAIAALCKRFVALAAPVFLGICLIGLVVYGIFTFDAADDVAAGIWLNIMHVAAAVPIVGLLVRELAAGDGAAVTLAGEST